MSIALWGTRPYAHFPHHVVESLYQQASTNGRLAEGGSTSFQRLPVNVWETDEAYLATLMAPGLDEQTINVTVHEDTLAIEGTLAFQPPEGAKAVWQEFNPNPGPSKFRRSLRLGAAVDPSRVEAVYRNGLLMVTLPKSEQAKPRQIQVQLASSATS
jgi:HSP20 family protein